MQTGCIAPNEIYSIQTVIKSPPYNRFILLHVDEWKRDSFMSIALEEYLNKYRIGVFWITRPLTIFNNSLLLILHKLNVVQGYIAPSFDFVPQSALKFYHTNNFPKISFHITH